MNSGVYKILNLVNGKIYIGSSVNIIKRRGDHFRDLRIGKHCNAHLQKAYKKYGEDNFLFSVIEVCNPDECITREQHYIDFYNASNVDFGYNICPNSASVLGRKHSTETIEKIRKSNSGTKLSDERKRHLSLINKGKSISAETRQKMSKSQKLRTMPDESRKKISKSHIGKVMSKEHCEAISNALRNSDKVGVKIAQYDKSGTLIEIHNSGRAAAIKVGFAYTNLYAHLNGSRKHIRNCIFKRHEND